MRFGSRIVLGLFLIILGAFLLLQTLGVIGGTSGQIVWALVLGVGGLYFLWMFFQDRRNWWWAIPGITLLGVSVSNFLGIFLPEFFALWGGLIVLGSIGLSFWVVFLNDRTNWWAVIPGGVLVTLGAISVLDEIGLAGFDSGGVLFLGIGLTFLLLFVLPTPHGRLRWAIYPALSLILFGVFVAYRANDQAWNFVGPSIAILAGLYFLVTSLRRR